MKYNIAWMFPDILFLHGERGNVNALKRYAEEYGYEVSIDRIDFSTKSFNPNKYDALLFGVGEISTFQAIIDWLNPCRNELMEYINNGKPMLVTGTSQCIFAKEIKRIDGSTINGLNLYDSVAVEREYVYGDDIVSECCYNSVQMKLAGNQIMMFDFVEDNATPFSTLIYGYGNSGNNTNEGHLINNAIFTNILGPILVCNPWLTIEMIKASAKFKGDSLKDINEDFELERNSLESKIKFNKNKATNLTNCK